MKAACLLTDSIYSLAISDRGRTKKDVLGLAFASVEETAGRDGTTGAGSVGRSGILVVSIGIGSWASDVCVGSGAGVGASGCGLSTSDVLAFDSGPASLRILPTLA